MIDNKIDGSGFRLKEIRKALRLTQIDFASIINTSNGHVSDMEKDRKNITDTTIDLLKLKCNVSEPWLRTGEGEMFIERSEEEEIADLVYELMDPKDDDFYIAVLELVRTYQELSPSSQKIIKEMASKFMNNLKTRKGD